MLSRSREAVQCCCISKIGTPFSGTAAFSAETLIDPKSKKVADRWKIIYFLTCIIA
jgi:hypothetical protein